MMVSVFNGDFFLVDPSGFDGFNAWFMYSACQAFLLNSVEPSTTLQRDSAVQ